ncbi:MAG: glycoside hydrolase family 2 TIM barrel-domain containing protein [Capsulimonadaceae bacterium]|nr:glycoside hydrolase family 2 TIM barrel-domain containing protein [Capsulimonadaceae bacterium]
MTTLFQSRISLHGQWQRSIGGRVIDFVTVPGSFRPMGECVLEYAFDAFSLEGGSDGDRFFLVTEGVLGHAEFRLNGEVLGRALPFTTYRFPVPVTLLRSRHNVVSVRIRDIVDTFGPMPGRRYDSGLNRDIYLERRPAAFIESVAFRPNLANDLASASCQILVDINGETGARVAASLAERSTGRVVATGVAAAGDPISIHVDGPRLWSPDRPDLYTLTVHVADEVGDTVQEIVGFRRLEVRGQDFFLNNERLILKGVCRHEFTSLHGYAPSYDEVRREMAMIKHTGFNYVRLVHSPHSPCVPRIAAELGLFVTEEPGTCWHDLSLPDVAEQACEALRRTILRDRNLPSIFAWYLYNECEPYVPYAVEAARRCRELDRLNFVATVNSTGNNEKIKEITAAADLAYYGINQYSLDARAYVDRMTHFTDRPLVFTEWGGTCQHSFLQPIVDMFVRRVQADAMPHIAGCCFWVWADYEEHSRGPREACEGWTIEGLLDQRARPREEWQMLSLGCFAMDHPEPLHAPDVDVLVKQPQRDQPWRPLALESVPGDQKELEAAVAKLRSRFSFANPSFGKTLVAGVPFQCREEEGQAPILLGQGRAEATIAVGCSVRSVAILGHVALHGGYPYSTTSSVYHPDQEKATELGSPASRYTFVFDDGEEEAVLLHGIHILRANNICRWWKTAPRTPETQPAVQTVLHPSYEVLRYDLWEHAFASPRLLKEIRWTLDDPDSIQAMLAISVLEA